MSRCMNENVISVGSSSSGLVFGFQVFLSRWNFLTKLNKCPDGFDWNSKNPETRKLWLNYCLNSKKRYSLLSNMTDFTYVISSRSSS